MNDDGQWWVDANNVWHHPTRGSWKQDDFGRRAWCRISPLPTSGKSDPGLRFFMRLFGFTGAVTLSVGLRLIGRDPSDTFAWFLVCAGVCIFALGAAIITGLEK